MMVGARFERTATAARGISSTRLPVLLQSLSEYSNFLLLM